MVVFSGQFQWAVDSWKFRELGGVSVLVELCHKLLLVISTSGEIQKTSGNRPLSRTVVGIEVTKQSLVIELNAFCSPKPSISKSVIVNPRTQPINPNNTPSSPCC